MVRTHGRDELFLKYVKKDFVIKIFKKICHLCKFVYEYVIIYVVKELTDKIGFKMNIITLYLFYSKIFKQLTRNHKIASKRFIKMFTFF
jgi:hypothetical protein